MVEVPVPDVPAEDPVPVVPVEDPVPVVLPEVPDSVLVADDSVEEEPVSALIVD